LCIQERYYFFYRFFFGDGEGKPGVELRQLYFYAVGIEHGFVFAGEVGEYFAYHPVFTMFVVQGGFYYAKGVGCYGIFQPCKAQSFIVYKIIVEPIGAKAGYHLCAVIGGQAVYYSRFHIAWGIFITHAWGIFITHAEVAHRAASVGAGAIDSK